MTSRVSVLAGLLALLAAFNLAAQEEVLSRSEEVLQQALADLEAGDVAASRSRLEALQQSGRAEDSAVAVLGAIYLETGDAAAAAATLKPLTEKEQPDPAVLYNYGRAAVVLGDVAVAERSLEESARLAPGSPAARELGLLRIALGDYFAAYLQLRPWVLTHPEDTQARTAAALCAVELERPGDASRLLSDLTQENPLVRLLWAKTQLMKQDPWGAIALLRPFVDDAPADLEMETRQVLAEAMLEVGNGEAAVELLSSRVNDDPSLAALLARAQDLVGDRQAALDTLRPLVEPMAESQDLDLQDSEQAAQGEVLFWYGELLAKSGDTLAGLPYLERAVRLDPLNPDKWESLGRWRTEVGMIEEGQAATRMAEALTAGAVQHQAGMELGDDLEDVTAQQLEQALRLASVDLLDEALELVRRERQLAPPEDPRPGLLEINLLLRLGRLEEAQKALEPLIDRFPGSADAYYQKAVIELARNDLEAAEASFRNTLELSPRHLAALNDLAVLLMRTGRQEEARQMLETVLALRPDDEVARRNLEAIE
ncbi:MAG: tetratricopeptide repeat protein [Thermoanaerobaculia bacterium]